MFFSLSLCAMQTNKVTEMSKSQVPFKKTHYAAAALDVITGLGLLAIGILATQMGFLPNILTSHVQYAFIGAGAAYTVGILAALGYLLKTVKAPNSYLCKTRASLI
ncbi:hypothetical protein ACFLR2_00815 [Chlamydiota bacterium]